MRQVLRAGVATLAAVAGGAIGAMVSISVWASEPRMNWALPETTVIAIYAAFGAIVGGVFAASLFRRSDTNGPRYSRGQKVTVGISALTALAVILGAIALVKLGGGRSTQHRGYPADAVAGWASAAVWTIFIFAALICIGIGSRRRRRLDNHGRSWSAARKAALAAGACLVLAATVVVPWRWEIQNWSIDAYEVSAEGRCGYFAVLDPPSGSDECGQSARAQIARHYQPGYELPDGTFQVYDVVIHGNDDVVLKPDIPALALALMLIASATCLAYCLLGRRHRPGTDARESPHSVAQDG